MTPLLRTLLLLPLLLPPCLAEEAPKPDLFTQVTGYWVVDFEAPETQTLIERIGADWGEEFGAKQLKSLKEEMALTTFQFEERLLTTHDPGHTEKIKLEPKSQNPKTKQIEASALFENGKTRQLRIEIRNNGLVLDMRDEEQAYEFGLRRIDKQAFDRRMAELANLKEAEATQTRDALAKEPEIRDGHPVATPVPDKEGFVFSPHSKLVVDVRGIPSGTLVADPTSPAQADPTSPAQADPASPAQADPASPTRGPNYFRVP